MEHKQDICPYGGGTELAKAKNATSYGRLCRYDSIFANGKPVFYLICLRCGTVVRSYVEDPNYFAK